MNSDEKAIGEQYAKSQHLSVEDIPYIAKAPKPKPSTKAPIKQAKEVKTEPQTVSDEKLLQAQAAYENARSEWAQGRMSAQEYDGFYATYMRQRAVYANERLLAAQSAPPTPQEPLGDVLKRGLETAKLERDDIRALMREAKREESVLRQEITTAKDAKAVFLSKGALGVLHDTMLPALAQRLKEAERTVENYEKRLRLDAGIKDEPVLTELQKREAAWREKDKTSYR